MDVIRVPRTDPAYNAHGYLTKVPEGAIRPFIERHTKPGETVLDPFAGSGMTGVAALILGRNAELSDISVLGQHIGQNLVGLVSADQLRAEAQRVMAAALKRVGKFYIAKCSSCRADSPFGKIVWSYVYACASCSRRLVYYDLLEANHWRKPGRCPHCREPLDKRTGKRIDEVPVLLHLTCTACGAKEARPLTAADHKIAASAARSTLRSRVPNLEIARTREMFRRSALGSNGYTSTATFFSPRNAIALTALHEAILAVSDPKIRAKLLFAFTAILPRASKRYQWHHKRPLNAQNQTYYIASVFYEWNIFDLYARKISAALHAQEYIQQEAGADTLFHRPSTVRYSLASADDLAHLPDASIDYVFTDPPFGSNMFYSDMSLFQEAWLSRTTDASREAVVYTDRTRHDSSLEAYEEILTGALRECRRVLKPSRRLSVVFSNSRGEIWAILQRAIRASGFAVDPDAIVLLDKGQRSVKGLSSGTEHVVTADLVLTLQRKEKVRQARLEHGFDARDRIRTYLAHAGADRFPTPSHAYLQVIRSAVREGVSLEPLHLSEVLATLKSMGLSVDNRTGKLVRASG